MQLCNRLAYNRNSIGTQGSIPGIGSLLEHHDEGSQTRLSGLLYAYDHINLR